MKKTYIIKTLDVSQHQAHIEDVIRLWRKSADLLGFFPEGAFREYAHKKQILIALDKGNHVIGYVLYRISKQKVSVTHLCVDHSVRNNGLSRKLIDQLRKETENFKGIGLFCRRDYSVNKLWPKLGFIPFSEKEGRGSGRQTLTYWWLDYRNPNLFTRTITNKINNRICIVLDANIFFDLDPTNQKQESIESKAIDSDWFKGETAIFVTNELYVEINRHGNSQERERQRVRAQKYDFLDTDTNDIASKQAELSEYLGAPKKEQDISDLRQLAHTIISNADYFITRDGYLLKQGSHVYERYGIRIRRPAEIILDVDILYDEVSYRPARLAGSLSSLKQVTAVDLDAIVEFFCLENQGENRRLLTKRLAIILAQPKINRMRIARKSDGTMMAVFATSIDSNGIAYVSFARVKDPILELTLARYLLSLVIRDAAKQQLNFIIFNDEYIQNSFIDALQDGGFLKQPENIWIKLIINEPMSLHSLEMVVTNQTYPTVADRNSFYADISKAIYNVNIKNDKFSSNELEKLIWPGKITDGEIPCFIVPIKPWWARDLFDEGLSNQDLFGANLNLAIQNEGIYYYSIRGAKTTAPARILWYVSQDKKFPGSSAIRACSILKEITIDTPKTLYKKYRRLGVYKWEDVLKTAGNDINNSLVAIHFSHTELFDNRIEWKQIQNILEGLDINTTIISATPVPTDIFMKIYRLGMNGYAE